MTATEIIKKYYHEGSEVFEILISHSMAVAHKAVSILQSHPEMAVNQEFIYEAAILHDIGVFLTDAPKIYCFGKHPYICHGYLGADLLRCEGLGRHALICERHTGTGLSLQNIVENNLPLPHRSMLPESLEEKLICYADKFYSKTKPDTKKTPEQIRKSLEKYGEDSVKRWDELCHLFACE